MIEPKISFKICNMRSVIIWKFKVTHQLISWLLYMV